MVVRVSNNLKLYLLPSLEALLNKHLRSKREGRFCQFCEFLLIVANTRAKTSKCICRTYHDWVANLSCSRFCLFKALACLRNRYLKVYLIEFFHKEVTIFCVHDSLYACSEHLNAIFLQHSTKVEFSTAVQCRLSTKGKHNTIWALFLDNLRNEVCVYRKEVDLICNTLTCLDSSYVRVYENRTYSFFSKSLQSLRT